MISILNFINFLYNAKISDGFSVNGLGDSPASGYMVSLEGYEKLLTMFLAWVRLFVTSKSTMN